MRPVLSDVSAEEADGPEFMVLLDMSQLMGEEAQLFTGRPVVKIAGRPDPAPECHPVEAPSQEEWSPDRQPD